MKRLLKAVLLCAGTGSRAWPLTLSKPKCLLELHGKPLLWYSLSHLISVGVEDFCFILGFEGRQIKKFVKTYFPQIQATFINNAKFSQTNSIYSYYLSIPYFLQSNFFRLDSDLIFTKNILSLLVSSRQTPVCAVQKKAKTEGEASTVAADYSGRILRFNTNIPVSKAYGEAKGIEFISAKSSPNVAHALRQMIKRNAINEYAEQSYQYMIDNGGTIYYKQLKINDFWCDVDRPTDFIFAKKNLHRLYESK